MGKCNEDKKKHKKKGVFKRRKVGFQKGHIPHNKGQQSDRHSAERQAEKHIVRLTRDKYELVVNNPKNCDTRQEPANMFLRPRSTPKSVVEQCAEDAGDSR